MSSKNSTMVLRFLAAPTDILMADAHGVSGGRVLEWIDKAAYACAVQWASTYCVTAYLGHIHFTRPIPSGHMVEVRARIALTGRSSMHIVNEVLSADPRTGIFTRACDCLVIFVAKDPETGKPAPVPEFLAGNDEEARVMEAAEARIALREAIKEEMDKQNYDLPSEAPRVIHRFLARPTDVNWGGKVHGGTAMEWIDEAGVSCTMEFSGEHTVAVYAGGIRFRRPISIGDLIEVDARLLRTESRAMHLSIQVRAGNPRLGQESLKSCIHASMTYLAVDDEGRPLPAKRFTPRTEGDKGLAQHAVNLRDLRAEYVPMPLVSADPTR